MNTKYWDDKENHVRDRSFFKLDFVARNCQNLWQVLELGISKWFMDNKADNKLVWTKLHSQTFRIIEPPMGKVVWVFEMKFSVIITVHPYSSLPLAMWWSTWKWTHSWKHTRFLELQEESNESEVKNTFLKNS